MDSVIERVAVGLSAVHSLGAGHGYLHRDIKPSIYICFMADWLNLVILEARD